MGKLIYGMVFSLGLILITAGVQECRYRIIIPASGPMVRTDSLTGRSWIYIDAGDLDKKSIAWAKANGFEVPNNAGEGPLWIKIQEK